ncbi:centrosomal protein of 131 kDa isoform X2 [Venturia canescens]|uniref:centrosomal protein of 131 kDa isoform X2 n=1 Tax=Venturia canescens TaxID=32260 RepID=UPI001C9C8FA0|nr:centrosomal protein of 131 kDa isoform X2 [Venturia canescens]
MRFHRNDERSVDAGKHFFFSLYALVHNYETFLFKSVAQNRKKMINIVHPAVTSKPPLKELCTGGDKKTVDRKPTRHRYRNVDPKCFPTEKSVEKITTPTRESPEEITLIDRRSDKAILAMKNDCNENLIEPESSSFQQLCNMINDLETNMGKGEQQGQFNPLQINVKIPMLGYFDQDQPEKDSSANIGISNGSTYEDIMNFLATLEQDTVLPEFTTIKEPPKRLEKKIIPEHPESLKEDLATALLQLEDREATLDLLKKEMRNERKLACEKMEKEKKEHCSELQLMKSKYQAIIKRHQKFIEQLIAEKKDLTEKCTALAQRIKEIEAKQQRELKCALDRHALELQRAKELCLASEKIRRERWLEAKTSKIKEMTVKGLEPELRSMVEQHQQEIQDIRSTHMKELQEVELRTIRRSNQQLEQLRLELTESHDKIAANEREALRTRFQEKFDEQEALLQAEQRRFFEELQQEKRKFAEEQTRRDEERNFAIKQSSLQFEEKMACLVRQNQIEKRTLEESLQSEREAWIENYRRQQNSKFEIAQAKVIDECNRERDRQIEIAIARLEKETRETKTNLQKSWENKIRCMREKYESELQDANERVKYLESKMVSYQEKLEELDRHVAKTEERLGQCVCELNESRQSVDKLTLERDEAKRIARHEIESEKRELEDKIASLYRELTQNNANRESVMAQLYSRIKLIVTQKDLSIKNVTREANDLREKCEHLEKLLDQQRKEYVLKSF